MMAQAIRARAPQPAPVDTNPIEAGVQPFPKDTRNSVKQTVTSIPK